MFSLKKPTNIDHLVDTNPEKKDDKKPEKNINEETATTTTNHPIVTANPSLNFAGQRPGQPIANYCSVM